MVTFQSSWSNRSHRWQFHVADEGRAEFTFENGDKLLDMPSSNTLKVGGADSTFVRDMSSRNFGVDNVSRWTRTESGIELGGISANHPLTLSLHISGNRRTDLPASQPLSLAVRVNGYALQATSVMSDYSWASWPLSREMLGDGRLRIEISAPTQTSGIAIWPTEVLMDEIRLEPAQEAGEGLGDFDELDIPSVIYLCLIVLLVYSFFAAGNRRVVMVGLAVSVLIMLGLAAILWQNRPLFVAYTGTLATALLLVRLGLPLLGPRGTQRLATW